MQAVAIGQTVMKHPLTPDSVIDSDSIESLNMRTRNISARPKTSTTAEPVNGSVTGRRTFVTVGAAAAAGLALTAGGRVMAAKQAETSNNKFAMRFAPHPGMFKALAGKDVIDQINFCHEQGFTAFEYNRINKESTKKQQEIGDALKQNGMQMGVFVAYADFVRPTFANPNEQTTKKVLDSIKESVDVAARCGAKFVTVVPGAIDQPVAGENKYGGGRLAEGFQTGYAIDLLRQCAEILEPHEIVMVLEPLNWHTNHGGAFLRDSDQAYAICRGVDSPSCKILFDIYHQQISEGNLIRNIERAWDEIAYFQAGDNPGRKEPGTGEINYLSVFSAIHKRAIAEGRDFIVGMEHGNSMPGKKGEQAVIDAYRAVDPKMQ